jgi:EpsI family protein
MTDSSSDASKGLNRRALLVGLSMLSAIGAAEAMRPRRYLAATQAPLHLDSDVPRVIGTWKVDDSIVPLEPDPSVQEKLDELYSQVLSRTYVNDIGDHVMLSIAYGSDQASEVTSVHRPEFCYRAQGFDVHGAGVVRLRINERPLVVQHLVAQSGARLEPISYWITLGNKVMLPGFSRRIEQLRFGLRGEIPDGMLVRISTVGIAVDRSFEVQNQFIAQLNAVLAPPVRARLFGA